MINVNVFGREMTPAIVNFGLSYDVNAETVFFRIPLPRAAAFDEAGVDYSVYWIASNGLTGADALDLTEDGAGALTGVWTPPGDALLFSGELRAEIQCRLGEQLVWHSMPLRMRVVRSLEDEGYESLVVPKYKEVTVDVHGLPEGSEPTGAVTQDGDSIDFTFGLPIPKDGEPGPPGNVWFATFDIEDVNLFMNTPDEYQGPGFELVDGHLEVVI